MKCFFTISFVLMLCACTSKAPAIAEKPVPHQESKPLEFAALPKAVLRPEVDSDVEAALHRVFGDAVIADKRGRWHAVGDFNGDGSPDLAVTVQPAKLAAVNDPLSNWTIQDADHAFFPPVGTTVVFRMKSSRPTVHRGDSLLAVIHGFGDEGWRDEQAQQAYLVEHGGRGSLEAISAPHHVRGAPLSINRSQVIHENSTAPGFLFWTGSQYAWRTMTDHAGMALKASDSPRQTARSSN